MEAPGQPGGVGNWCPLSFPALLPRIILSGVDLGYFGVCAGMTGGFWKSRAEPSR